MVDRDYLYRYNPAAVAERKVVHAVPREYPDRLLCSSGRQEGKIGASWLYFDPDYDAPLTGYCFCSCCHRLLEKRRRARRVVIRVPAWILGCLVLALALGACGDFALSDPLPGCKTLVPAAMIAIALILKGGTL